MSTTFVSGKVPNWLQPKSGQYNATMGGYESQFPAWCSPTSAANQLGHLVDHGGVTQPTNINDGIDAGNDSPFALASSTIAWDSGYGWGDYMLDGPTYRAKNLFNGTVTDFGWYMNTNDLGPLGAGAGSPVGSTLQNIYHGMVDFYQQVGYTNMVGMVYHFNGSIQNFGVDPEFWTANGHTALAGDSADYTVTLETIKHEITNNRTVIACFNGWNITDAVHPDASLNGDETSTYRTLGEFLPDGPHPHGEVFNIHSTEGDLANVESYNAGLGHTVLIVGYIPAGAAEDPTGNTEWLVVRDNYTTTHKNVIIPFANLNNLLATVYVNHTTATYNAVTGGATATSTPDPVIHYTFDTDGTNSGTLGSSNDAIIPTSISSNSDPTTIDTTQKLFGNASIKVGTYAVYADAMPKFYFNTGTAWSISFWARHNNDSSRLGTGTNPRRALTNITKNPNNQTWGERWEFSSTATGNFVCKRGAGGTNFKTDIHSHIFSDEKWHHYVISVSSNTNDTGCKFYVDNTVVPLPDNSTEFPIDMEDNTDYLFILGGNHYANKPQGASIDEAGIDGNFDQVRVYNYALSDAQIQSLYKETITITPPIIHHDFNPTGTNKGSLTGSYDISTANPVIVTDPVHVQTGLGAFYTGELGTNLCDLNTGTFTTSNDGFFVSFWFKHDYDMRTNQYYPKKTKQELIDAGTSSDAGLAAAASPNEAYITHVINSAFFVLIDDDATTSNKVTQFCYHSVNIANNKIYPLIWQNAIFQHQVAINIGIEDDATTSPPTIGLYDGGNDFHHMVINYSGDTVKVYCDNILMHTETKSGFNYNNISYNAIRLGTGVTGEANMVDTYFNDFKIYNYAADATTRDIIYKLGSNTDVASLSGISFSTLQSVGATPIQMITTGISLETLETEGLVTVVDFVGNTLTINNSTNPAFFMFPANHEMKNLIVTNFVGTGTISYTLSTDDGAADITGTFYEIGQNLLTELLVKSANTNCILTLTGDAAITYTIEGSIAQDLPSGLVEREYPPAWVRNYIANNTINNEGTGTNQWGSLDVSITVDDANETYGQGTYTLSASQRRSGGGVGLYYITSIINGLTDVIDTNYGGPYLKGWYANINNGDNTTNTSWVDINWIDLENGNATGTITTAATLTIEFPESFQPTKFQIFANAQAGPVAQILFGYDEANNIYDRLVVGNATWTTELWKTDINTDHSDFREFNITQTTPKRYKKYAVTADNSNLDNEIWAEIRLWGMAEVPLTTTDFVNNTLTIENSMNQNDPDVVAFVLPAGEEMASLNVTNFVGTGTISYKISATGATDITGTITAIGDNLLANNPLVANADITYTLRLTASAGAAITYTIVGTKNDDYQKTTYTNIYSAEREYPPQWVRDYIKANQDANLTAWKGTDVTFNVTSATESYGQGTYILSCNQVRESTHGVVGTGSDRNFAMTNLFNNDYNVKYWNNIVYTGWQVHPNQPMLVNSNFSIDLTPTLTITSDIPVVTIEFPDAFIITKYTLWGAIDGQGLYTGHYLFGYDETAGVYDLLNHSNDSLNNTSATYTVNSAGKLYKKYAFTNNKSTSDGMAITPELRFYGNGITETTEVDPPSSLSFNNNILTIENSINQNDKDDVRFTLPVADEMYQLVVSNYAGTGAVNYEITTGETTIKSGTISNVGENTAIGTNLLDGNALTSAVGSIYEVKFSGATAPISYTILGTKVSDYGDSSTPTTLVFTNDVLTIDNLTSTTDTDVIDFVLPAGYNIPELNVTNFNGTGDVNYTLATGGNTIAIGTFSAISSNLLPSGFPIFALSTDITYVLTITATATISYTIVGTKAITNLSNYSTTHFFSSGFTEQQLIDGGVWDADSNANRFNPTYTEGFLDISGNVKVRDNILMDTGAIDLHSFTYTDPYAFTADVSINNRLFVVGDVSMGDASLNIVGDISINGVMTVGSYKPASISTAAVVVDSNPGFSTANSITTFTEDIAYNKKIQFNGDISLNTSYTPGYYSTFEDLANSVPDTTTTSSNAITLNTSDTKIITSTRQQNVGSGNHARIDNTGRLVGIIGGGGGSYDGQISLSRDYGDNWTNIGTNGIGIAISADGTYLCKVESTTGIHISTDEGVTWTNTYTDFSGITFASSDPYHGGDSDSAQILYEADVCISGNGQYICVIPAKNTNVLMSNDFGESWSSKFNVGNGYLFNSRMSISGEYICIHDARFSGKIWVSNDYGDTFLENSSTKTGCWGMSMSSSGEYIYLQATSSSTFCSKDFGVTFGSQSHTLRWGDHATGDRRVDGYCHSVWGPNPNIQVLLNMWEPWLFVSVDGGLTYNVGSTQITTALGQNYQYFWGDPKKVLGLTISNDGKYLFFHTKSTKEVGRVSIDGIGDWVPPVFGNSDATTYFGANTTLKANTGIEFPDGTTLHSSNKEANGTTFKASTFNGMTVIGDFASNPIVTSDYRIKNNVETLDEIHTVDNLRPVKYKQTQTGKNDIGFLAHELQEHYPELVEGEKDGDKMQSVNYSGLLPILINEVQQLKKQIAETRARIHNETP